MADGRAVPVLGGRDGGLLSRTWGGRGRLRHLLVGLCRRQWMQVPREQSTKIKLEKKQSRNREMYSRAISLKSIANIQFI